MLNIVPSTSEERKALFAEILFSKTNKINKISDHSINNGVAYGIAKVSGKAEKDIVLAVSKLFPDSAFGTQLDQVAIDNGIAPRFGASQSTTYVRVVGDPGTKYIAGIHVFKSSTGIEFDIQEDVTIGTSGFNYVKVKSVDSGLNTNVKAGSITSIIPSPSGHQFCVNEYQALYGRDAESDVSFRQRIKEGPNILATGTLSCIEQAFMLINNNILSVKYQGINNKGQLRLAVITQNGAELTLSERNQLLIEGEKFFGLSELRPFGRNSYGVEIINLDWQTLDMSFRCVLYDDADPDLVRISIQTRVAKYLDFRNFEAGVSKIEWDNLLEITKNTKGVKYVPDEYFYPAVDIPTDRNKLPRLRGFLMLNLDGSIINNLQNAFNPVFYPATNLDFSFQQTVLRSLI